MKNVYLVGEKKRGEVFKILAHAQFSICPSEWYEVLGFSIIESMLVSKPVIGSKLGAIPELVIDGKTGLTFRPGSTGDLMEKVQFLWNNPEAAKNMGHQAMEHVKVLTNPERYYQDLMQIMTHTRKIGV